MENNIKYNFFNKQRYNNLLKYLLTFSNFCDLIKYSGLNKFFLELFQKEYKELLCNPRITIFCIS